MVSFANSTPNQGLLQKMLLNLQLNLGVERQGRWSEWLIRIFLLPQARPTTQDIVRAQGLLPRTILKAVAGQLGIHAGAPWWHWLKYLILLPPADLSLINTQSLYHPPHSFRIRMEKWIEATALAMPNLSMLMGKGVMWLPIGCAIGITLVPLDLQGQMLFFLVIFLCALLLTPIEHGVARLFLVVMSLIIIFRYAFWRTLYTMDVDGTGNLIYAYSLLLAEGFTWMVTGLSFIQSIGPLKREVVPLPDAASLWPHVDVFIPTYNEPLEIVRVTALATLSLDWPKDRLHVYILDDGRRDDFKQFADQAGLGYITRHDNLHAKAGNLNHALQQTGSEYVAIFDCDHIPVRTFLRNTIGCMLADPEVALVQTPHHFYSPDPFERNLDTFRRIPNEGYLFNRLVQDGNDLWNAAFFCGSCAVLKREALATIGGIATETVTEDAHTALKLHRRGYRSAYINMIQAAGLATESLASHIGQRIRWARGMAQIFRIDNPLTGGGLSIFQRLCYLNASMHFFFGLPRLIFLTAPLGYLFFDLHFINADPLLLFMYGFPYLAFANLTNNRLQGRYRHAFWAEIYETALSAYIAIPTTLALIHPAMGRFNVTPKGGIIPRGFFDWQVAFPFLVLFGLNLSGLLAGIYRLVWTDDPELQVLYMNMFWTIYNLLVLGVVFGVASESRRLRKSQRISARLKANLYLDHHEGIPCEAIGYSSEDLVLALDSSIHLPLGGWVSVGLVNENGESVFSGRLLSRVNEMANISILLHDIEEETRYIMATHARQDAWQDALEPIHAQSVPASIMEIMEHSVKGYLGLGDHLLQAARGSRR